MIHVIREKATARQIQEMLESLTVYIKVAVDIRQGILAGGGILHADCEALLLEAECRQEDIWGNRRMEIQDPAIRTKVEKIVRDLLEAK